MTSKISCIKFIKEDLRQRTWLIAILSTVTFLFQPLMLIIGINEKEKLDKHCFSGLYHERF